MLVITALVTLGVPGVYLYLPSIASVLTVINEYSGVSKDSV